MSLLERYLYAIPEPPKRTRERPMQVLALGMSRSGTDSLRRALVMLGYDHVYHGFDMSDTKPMMWKQWALLARRKYGVQGTHLGDPSLGREDFDALLGHAEAVTDQPCAIFATELIKAYPEAKVILNYREVDSWYESLCNVVLPHAKGFGYHVLPYFNADMYWATQYAKDCFDRFFHGSLLRNGKWVYEEHSAKIRGAVSSDRLLEWKVQDGWEPLCKFLEKPVPSEEFPSGNTLDATNQRYDNNMLHCAYVAIRNFGLFVLCIGVLGAYMAGWICQPA